MSRRVMLPLRHHPQAGRLLGNFTSTILRGRLLPRVRPDVCRPSVAQARTITNLKYGRRLGKSYRDESRHPEDMEYFPPPGTAEPCASFGFSQEQTITLWHVLVLRLSSNFTPLDSYEWLNNHTLWTRNPDTIPSHKRSSEQGFIEGAGPYLARYGSSFSMLGEHDPHQMAKALNVFGLRSVTAAFDPERAEPDPSRPQLRRAFYMLEMAVVYKNLESAVWLLRLRADPELAKLNLYPNTTEAKNLVHYHAKNHPRQCPWQAMATYIENDYRLFNLRRYTPEQRAWAIENMKIAGNEVLPGDEADSTYDWARFQNPWRLLLRIVDNCFQFSLPVDTYSQEELQTLRLVCLRKLTEFNDPAACFDVATREKEFGSEAWVRLMTCAAADAQPDACWLLAIHYWREGGLLNVNETDAADVPAAANKGQDFIRNLGFEYAEVALFSQQDRPDVLYKRAGASAALFRAFGARESGGLLLQKIVDHTKHLRWFSKKQGEIETMLDDYRSEDDRHNLWTLQKCFSRVKKITDTNRRSVADMGIVAEYLPQPAQPVIVGR